MLDEHKKLFSGQERNLDSIRRNFASLFRKKMPTGDSLMPPDVKRAKHIRYKMTERSDMSLMDDMPDSSFPTDDSESADGSLEPIAHGEGQEEDEDNEKAAPKAPRGSRVIEKDDRGSHHTSGSLPTPRPLVNRRNKTKQDHCEDLISILNLSLIHI